MINIATLEKTSVNKVLSCFNLSFSDYSIPFRLELQQLESKIRAESIDLRYSVGAFREGELIGFILHGVKENDNLRFAYNGGTGVIPSERGQGLTCRMYNYVLPKLKAENFESVILEVICNNKPAIKSYEKVGFKKTRSLNCYSGTLETIATNPDIKVEPMKISGLKSISHIGEVKPTWQNSNEAIMNMGKLVDCLGAYESGKLCGYCVINTTNNRILQMAVAKETRNKKIGSSIIEYVKRNYSNQISMINVDTSSDPINKFLENQGLSISLQQNEMKLELEKALT